MKKAKKILITLLIVAIIVSGSGYGIHYFVAKNNKSHKAAVTYIDNVCTYGYDENNTNSYGITYSGGGQNVYLDEGDIIKEALVHVGDNVDIGTPLIQLDAEKLKLELDSCVLTVQQDDLDISLAQKMIEKYKAAVPYVEEPETEEPETEDESEDDPYTPSITTDNILSSINNAAQAFEGAGSETEPYKFKCSADCTIDAALFKSIEKSNMYCNLYIYSAEMDDFAYVCSLSPSGKNTAIKKNYTWKVGTIYTLADGTETIQLNSELPPIPCEFSTYVDEYNYDDDFDDDFDDFDDFDEDFDDDSDEANDSIDGKYTQEELNNMIIEKQKELSEYQLQKRSDELSVKKAQAKYNKATITSTVKGVITSINEGALDGEAVMVISDQQGIYVKTAIDEYSYDKYKVGDTFNVISYGENGEINISATITSISPYPTNDSNFAMSSNKSLSFYPVIASIPANSGINVDEYVDISFNADSSSDEEIFAIDKAYVGEDDKGHFLYLVDDKDTIKKTYVNTGKTIYDSYLEIKDEIDTSGYIASPYTKYAADGVKADVDNIN